MSWQHWREGPGRVHWQIHFALTAHWGSTVLPAGDYTVRLVATQTNERVLEIRSVAKSAIVLTAVADTKVTSDHSELILELINGAYFVRKFAVLELGVTFVYPVPKA